MWNELVHSIITFGRKLYFGIDNQLNFLLNSMKVVIKII